MARSHLEMAHVLGLQENPFLSESNVGWEMSSAIISTKNRYKQLRPSTSSYLNFDLLPSSHYTEAAKKITDLPNGGYIGFSCYWFGHAYSLHAVKEENQTHFIYVNRGQRHTDVATGKSKHDAPTVLAFSLGNNEAERFAKAMMSAAMTIGDTRKIMSAFLEKNQDKYNPVLSKTLEKKDQKTGNCSVANSNVAWHFQLASDEMKSKGTSFAQAYENTKSNYREMRVKDRVQAFRYLLNDRGCYLSDTAFLYNYFESLGKMNNKDRGPAQTKHLATLADGLSPNNIPKLIEPLVNTNFIFKVEEYINARVEQIKKKYPSIPEEKCKKFAIATRKNLESARNNMLSLVFNKLPPEQQKELIAKDNSLVKYASSDVELAFLQQNYNKFSLYSSQKSKSMCKEYKDKMEHEAQWIYQKSFSELEEYERDNIEFDFMADIYQKRSNQIASERKTNGNFLLSKDAEQKEAKINNTLRTLYSYLSTEDQANAKRTLEDLCKTCCERRFYLSGNKYSTHIQSAKWLVERIGTNDDIGEDLRKLLGVKTIDLHEIKSKVQNIISGKNENCACHTISYKEQLQAQKPMNPEPLPIYDEHLSISAQI
ncbi:hypothetical protein [Legionella sp. WA2022007384]